MISWLGPAMGVVVFLLAFAWTLHAHRKERRSWLESLGGAIEGVASDAQGAFSTIRAPFSGRPCLGYVLDVVVQESFANQTTCQRVHCDGAGRFVAAGVAVDLSGAQPIFPPAPGSYAKLAAAPETVFQGPMQNAPAHLAAFVETLAPTVKQVVWRPNANLYGKRVHFNERVVAPGQRVVVVARRGGAVSLGFGTIESERRRISKLPISGELFGAIAGGILALAVVEAIVCMTGCRERATAAPAAQPSTAALVTAAPTGFTAVGATQLERAP